MFIELRTFSYEQLKHGPHLILTHLACNFLLLMEQLTMNLVSLSKCKFILFIVLEVINLKWVHCIVFFQGALGDNLFVCFSSF